MTLPGAWLLLAPAGLLGLLAVAIPVAIHLISRGRGRRVLIGNIELVRQARTTRVTSLRLTQKLLLALRVLIVLVAALLLARLALQGMGTVAAGASYVTPGFVRAANASQRATVLAREPAARVLTAGYPRVQDYVAGPAGTDGDVWSLLAERLSLLRHSGTIDVYAEQSAAAFGPHRPRLPYEINWLLTAGVDEPEPLPSRGLVIHDAGRADAARDVERALSALQRHRLPLLQWDTCRAGDAACASRPHDWLIWLADGEPPADNARVYRPAGTAWAQASTDPRYPESLLDIVLSDEQRRRAWRQIPLSAEVLATSAAAPASLPLPSRSSHAWLGFVLLVLWALERALSERRQIVSD